VWRVVVALPPRSLKTRMETLADEMQRLDGATGELSHDRKGWLTSAPDQERQRPKLAVVATPITMESVDPTRLVPSHMGHP
jgi:hypothetical protein